VNCSLLQVLKESNPGNLIFSPLSLSAVVAMLKPGAKGKTGTEIQTGMKFPDDQILYKGYSSLLQSLQVPLPVIFHNSGLFQAMHSVHGHNSLRRTLYD
jgi:serine protease inhibitor